MDKLSSAVEATGAVDYTTGSFVRTYAVVFAASTFLTLLLWLWAVTKRAVRGVPLTKALGEAVGLLWLTVMASAFTPLVLYTIVSAVDGITEVLAGGGHAGFFEAFSEALRKSGEQAQNGAGAGGPIVVILLSFVSILAAGVVWLELVIRTALLYTGAVLGTVVYSGLVDRELWSRVRRWCGIMGAIILAKPIIVVVLRLASALSGGDASKEVTNAVISGLAIIIIAIFASAMLFRMIPGMGDDIVAARRDSYDPASRQSLAAVTRPVGIMQQGISTHASRDAVSRPQPQTTASQSSAASGMSAHATRSTEMPARPPRAPRVTQPGGNESPNP